MRKEYEIEEYPKPCANCGNKNVTVEQEDYLPSYWVRCLCGLVSVPAASVRLAVKIWNSIVIKDMR